MKNVTVFNAFIAELKSSNGNALKQKRTNH